MESLLFRKVEIWVLGILAIAGVIALIGFGMLVRNKALGHDKFGLAGDVAFNLASIPATARELLGETRGMKAYEGESRFGGARGWVRHNKTALAGAEGYLLISRFDGTVKRHAAQLFDLQTADLVHEWRPDFAAIYKGVTLDDSYNSATIHNDKFRIIHPILFDNGDLLIKDHDTPMARIGWCGKKIWTTKETFHHSTEKGENGTIWSAGINRPGNIKFEIEGTDDDALVQISDSGEVLKSVSVAKALLENGYEYLAIGMSFASDADPLHLNDVEPVLSDGKYWKKGDVFVSLRHKSTIFLYRPSTEKIIWLRSGPWLFQHDVDIVGDGKIAVFNNNMNLKALTPEDGRTNRISVYDFATDTVSDIQFDALQREKVRTVSEGLFTQLPSGHLMVEEENFGRLLVFAPNGEVAAEYINGASDGITYRMGWSRFIPKDLGDSVLEEMADKHC